MTLTIKFGVSVEPENETEREQAERLQAQIERDGMDDMGSCTSIDLSHLQDIAAVIRDLNQIIARARASRKA